MKFTVTVSYYIKGEERFAVTKIIPGFTVRLKDEEPCSEFSLSVNEEDRFLFLATQL